MSNLKAMAAVSLVVTLTACSGNIKPPEAGVQPRHEQPAPNDNGAVTGVAERAPNVTKVFNLLEVRGADPI